MNKTLVSYAALALLGLGGAAAATDAEARGFNFGAFGGRGAIPLASHSASAVQRTSAADSLLKTTNRGAIGLSERGLSRRDLTKARKSNASWDLTKVSK